jgi:hypothetical protein
MRIGATHEYHGHKADTNVQIQGLPGRMTGYWRKELVLYGHKTGPYRTSIESIRQYEKFCDDPFDPNSKYNGGDFSKNGEELSSGTPSLLHPKNIKHLTPIDIPFNPINKEEDKAYEVFDTQDEAIQFGKNVIHVTFRKRKTNDAPKELQKNGQNPTVDYLIQRMWGIYEEYFARMVPTNDNKWCVYWRPSLVKL